MGHEIIKNVYKVDVAQRLIRRDFGLLLGSYDHAANLFVVELVEGFTSYPIDGRIVKGYFIRPDGKTLVLQGEAEGNSAIVGLSDSCYLYDGSFTLTVKVDDQTILICDGQIAQTRTDQTTEFPEIITRVSDAEMLGGKAPAYYLPVVNLLDNSNFRRRVNARGKTAYTGTANAYTIDRWLASTAAVSINLIASGINIDNRSSTSANGHMTQRLANVTDGTYTLCANTSSGVILRTFTLTGGALSTGNVTNAGTAFTAAGYSNSILTVQIGVQAGSVVTVYWAALYEGSYTAATLPPYVPKPYAVEEYECMRYYQVRSTNNVPAVDMRPTMRLTNPTITAVGSNYAYSADL